MTLLSPDQETPEAMLEFLLKNAPDQFALVGHSMCGWLALEILRAAPERVFKLALVNTTAQRF